MVHIFSVKYVVLIGGQKSLIIFLIFPHFETRSCTAGSIAVSSQVQLRLMNARSLLSPLLSSGDREHRYCN